MPIDIDIVDLDDYVGDDVATAQSAIEALGFTVRLAYDYDNTAAIDEVIAQDVVSEGEAQIVILTVSLGPGASIDPRRTLGRLRGGRTRRTLRIRYTP